MALPYFQTFPREGPLVARAKELGPVQVGDRAGEGDRRRFFDWSHAPGLARSSASAGSRTI